MISLDYGSSSFSSTGSGSGPTGSRSDSGRRSAGYSSGSPGAQRRRTFAVTGSGADHSARAMVNHVRSGILEAANTSTPTPAMRPYLSYKSFPPSLCKDSDYYQETIFHAGLAGARVFNLWNTHANATLGDNAIVGATLAELSEVLPAGSGGGHTRLIVFVFDVMLTIAFFYRTPP